MMKRPVGVAFALVALLALSPLVTAAQEEAPPEEEIAFRINGKAFTRAELVESLKGEYEDDYREILILRFLVEEEAKKADLDLASVDKRVEEMVESNLQRAGAGDREGLRKRLRAVGLSYEGWKQAMRTTIISQDLLNLAKEPPEQELKILFERTYGEEGVLWKVRHILAGVNVSASDLFTQQKYREERDQIEADARAAAEAALERLRNGEEFGTLALELSDDPATATPEKKGDLGVNYRHLGEEFGRVARETPAGQAAGPITSNRGIHVIEVTGMDPSEFDAQQIFLNTRVLRGMPEEERAARLEALKAEAEKIVKEAVGGKSFEETAKAHDDRGPGGQVRTYPVPSPFGPDFDKAIGEMKEGEIRGPIEGRNGLHIVKLHKRTFAPSVRHILFSTQYNVLREKRVRPILEEQAMERIDRVQQSLASGADFAELAAQHSDDVATKTEGGLISNYRSQRFGPEFHEALAEMQPGGPPRVVKTRRHGVHLVELMEVTRTEMEAVREDLVKQWRESQRSQPQELQAWLDQLRASAKVEIPGSE